MTQPGKATHDEPPPGVRTLLVAQTLLYREGLARLLNLDPRLAVVGTAPNIRGGLIAIRETHPDVVLLDVELASEAWNVGEIVRASPATVVVAFGVADDEETVIRCAEAGVAGYVSCEAGVDELIGVVTGAIRDEVVCSPRLAGTLLRRVGAMASELRGTDRPAVRLTARETQVLALIDDGLANKEIATRLQISLPTVKNHIHNLLEKLNATRRGEAAARARELRVGLPDRIA